MVKVELTSQLEKKERVSKNEIISNKTYWVVAKQIMRDGVALCFLLLFVRVKERFHLGNMGVYTGSRYNLRIRFWFMIYIIKRKFILLYNKCDDD